MDDIFSGENTQVIYCTNKQTNLHWEKNCEPRSPVVDFHPAGRSGSAPSLLSEPFQLEQGDHSEHL